MWDAGKPAVHRPIPGGTRKCPLDFGDAIRSPSMGEVGWGFGLQSVRPCLGEPPCSRVDNEANRAPSERFTIYPDPFRGTMAAAGPMRPPGVGGGGVGVPQRPDGAGGHPAQSTASASLEGRSRWKSCVGGPVARLGGREGGRQAGPVL